MNKKIVGNMTDGRLILWLSMAGVAMAILIIAQLHGRINNDATLYLEMAKRFAEGDSKGALGLYSWGLFPWLMAKTSWLTGLSVQYSAHLLSVLFFGIAIWSFLTLIREAGGNRVTIISGALLLYSAPYIVGDVLPMIMRDQGFWAFYLLSLLCFLRYSRGLTWPNALGWQLAASVAVMFRVEGIAFIAFLPFLLLMDDGKSWRDRAVAAAKAYALPAVGLAVLIATLVMTPGLDLQHELGRLAEVQSSLMTSYHQLTGGLAGKAQVYGEQVLGRFMAEYAMTGLLLTLLVVVLSNIVGASGWLGIILAMLLPSRLQGKMDADARKLFYWIAGINLLNLVVIILSVFLLSGRYAVPLAFTILIFAAFRLGALYEEWETSASSFSTWKKALYLLPAVVIVLLLTDNLIQRGNYPDYEQQAGEWIKQNIPAGSPIFFDDARMRYYAGTRWNGRDTSWDRLMEQIRSEPKSPSYRYLVLHLKHKHPEAKQALLDEMHQYRMIKQFVNKNGDKLLVLENTSTSLPKTVQVERRP